ncbi:MAG: DUF2079 domain-containing protein [Anaerolineae bacterium]
MASVAQRKPWTQFKKPLRGAALVLAVGFLAALLVTQWQALRSYPWQLRPAWLLPSFACLLLSSLFELSIWWFLLNRLGSRLAWGRAAQTWFLSNAVRYIPGNVWQFLGMAELAADDGVNRVTTFTSIVLHQALNMTVGLALALVGFAFTGQASWLQTVRPFLILAPLALIICHPRVLEWLLNKLLTALKRPPLHITLTFAQLLVAALGYAGVWLLSGAGFALLVATFTPITLAQTGALLAAWIAAYVIGYLSLLTPGGLGVREGALVALLAPWFVAPLPTVISLAARLWAVVFDLVGAGVALWARRGSASAPLVRPRVQPSASAPDAAPPAAPRWALGLLVVLIALFSLYFSALAVQRHAAHTTHMADLGQMDQAIWNTSRGRFVMETKGEDPFNSRLTDHVEPIFAPVSLVFWLWNDVRALLILQVLALAFGAWPVFQLAWLRLAPHGPPDSSPRARQQAIWHAVAALAFAAAWLLFPAVQAPITAEFHALPLAAPLILAALLALARGQWGRFVLFALLVAAVQEGAALLAAMLGLYTLGTAWSLYHQGRAGSRAAALAGGTVALVGGVWFALATFVIIPSHAAQAYGLDTSPYVARFGALGDSFAGVLKALITQPGLVLRVIAEPLRLEYLLKLLAPVGFLALAGPEIALLGLPLLLANLLSAYPLQYSGQLHYSAPLAAFVIVAAIVGSQRVARAGQWLLRRGRRTHVYMLLTGWLLLAGLAAQLAWGYAPLGAQFKASWPAVTAHHRLLARFAAQIPPDAALSTSSTLYPHFSHRQRIFLFPALADSQFVLLDQAATSDWTLHPTEMRNRVQALLAAGDWAVQDAADGYLLLRRQPGSPALTLADLPVEFFTFARSDAAPQTALDILFTGPAGEQLKLVGYDLLPDSQWRSTGIRLYWQALTPLPAGIQPRLFARAPDGREVDSSDTRPLIQALWLPPEAWPVGETIVTDKLPWYLPRQWALGVGVYTGDEWQIVGNRWHAASADPQTPVFEFASWARLGMYQWQDNRLEPLAAPYFTDTAHDFSNDQWAVRLTGVQLPAVTAPGKTVPLVLRWQAEKPFYRDLTLFLYVRDAGGNIVAQADAMPTWFGILPTTLWPWGQPVFDAHRVALPDTLPPGLYDLVIGWYDQATLARWPLLDSAGNPVGDELVLGPLTVGPHPMPAPDLPCALIAETCLSQ